MTKHVRRMGVVLAAAALLTISLSPSASHSREITPAQAIEQHLQAIDSGLIVNDASRRVAGLLTFYSLRDFRPVWVERGKPTEAAGVLREVLRNSARDGLDPDYYDAGEFSPKSTYDIARYEVAQSAAVLRYLGDLRHGRTAPSLAEPDLFVAPRLLDPNRILLEVTAVADIETYLDGFVPANSLYRRLRTRLVDYREIDAAGGWGQLGDGTNLELGSTGQTVLALRRRLERTMGPLSDSTDDSRFGEILRAAVMRFQNRHGLEPDGVVGRRTRAALNVSAADRIRQIIVNMERWRWMPDDLGRRHILVNIAGFELDAVSDGLVQQNMRVVVGKPYRRTPVFSGRMTYVEINPFWHVPPSIAVKDLLPKIRQSVDYMSNEGIRIFDGWGANARELEVRTIDWSGDDPAQFPYKLRQDPGPKNALGRIKFMFPNKHNVYLHDTPSHDLFGRAVRTFSSGCIRVERARDLARFVLDGNKDWSPAAQNAAFESKETRAVQLHEPLPVHITYQTAWVGEDGMLQFRDDIYERDAALGRLLFDGRDPASR